MKRLLVILFMAPIITIAQESNDSTILAKVRELAKPVYMEAYRVVHNSKKKVEWAYAKHINASEAIDYYNTNLGPIMGKLKTLIEVKKRLDSSGDDYIEYMFLKEQAKVALMLAEVYQDAAIYLRAEESYNKLKEKSKQ